MTVAPIRGAGAPRVRPEAEASAPGQIVPVRLTMGDVKDPPRETFVLGSLVPFAKASVLFGPTGVGKSALAAQVAFAFAAGAESLWGLPLYYDKELEERGGPVLVYTAEDSLDDWRRKAAALLQDGALDVSRALERTYIIDKSDGVARLSELVTLRENDPAGGSVARRLARPTEEQDAVIAAIRQVGARFALVETASRLVEDEDNPNMSALLSSLGRIARETGAAVLVSHHPTKAASKENDAAVESARGGGALVGNARNVLSLFPADPEAAKPWKDRFPVDDLVVLAHAKATSSTRRQAPVVLVRCDAIHGAVFRRPDEVALSPEQEQRAADRMEHERERERHQLRRLYQVVVQALQTGPVSVNRLREDYRQALGCSKHQVAPLVQMGIDRGVLKVATKSNRGITLALGRDPHLPVGDPRGNE